MSIETGVTKRSDERVNHYMGVAARIALAVTCVGCTVVAGWYVFEGVTGGTQYWLRNTLMVMTPPFVGMAVFTALQLKWRAFA